ncbi:MAG: hypothetical protein L3J74_07235 [Bacteroidales bacterium]|nr:hypothetical protein [Bacteroidales bacterium]
MDTLDTNNALFDSYFGLIKNLCPELKLELIEKLTRTLRENVTNENSILKSFGMWESVETADEIISGLRNSRKFIRKIESL